MSAGRSRELPRRTASTMLTTRWFTPAARLFLDPGDDVQDLAQHLERSLRGVDGMDQGRAVEIEHRLGLALVGLEPPGDDVEVGVIEAILAQRPPLQAF